MRPRRILRWEGLIASLIVVAAVAAIAQTPSDYVYVLPKFSPDSTAELILSNLSPRLVTADITFYDPVGASSTVYAEVAANGQMRATPDNFAAYGARKLRRNRCCSRQRTAIHRGEDSASQRLQDARTVEWWPKSDHSVLTRNSRQF